MDERTIACSLRLCRGGKTETEVQRSALETAFQ
jgi:hypothetical protein